MTQPKAARHCRGGKVIPQIYGYTVKPPIGNPPMAEHTADTEQFPWSQHASLTYRRFQLRNNVLLGTKNLVPNPFLIWSFYCTCTSIILVKRTCTTITLLPVPNCMRCCPKCTQCKCWSLGSEAQPPLFSQVSCSKMMFLCAGVTH